MGGKGRLESITEGEELGNHENANRHRKEFLCSSLEDIVKEFESIDSVVDDLAMINIHDDAIGDNKYSGDVNDCPPHDEGIAVGGLKRSISLISELVPIFK